MLVALYKEISTFGYFNNLEMILKIVQKNVGKMFFDNFRLNCFVMNSKVNKH